MFYLKRLICDQVLEKFFFWTLFLLKIIWRQLYLKCFLFRIKKGSTVRPTAEMANKQARTTSGQISSMIEQTSTMSTIDDLSRISFSKISLRSLNSLSFKDNWTNYVFNYATSTIFTVSLPRCCFLRDSSSFLLKSKTISDLQIRQVSQRLKYWVNTKNE